MKLVIIRLKDGSPFIGRAFDTLTIVERDMRYSYVEVPEFESDVIAPGIMSINGLSPKQIQMVRTLALPLFPECCEGNITEGEEWKKE